MAEVEEVDFDGEKFSLQKYPGSESALVSKQRKVILGSINLVALVEGLSSTSRCLRIAYNGSHSYGTLQKQIQEVAIRLAKLNDRATFTIYGFKKASRTVRSDLESCYEYLLMGDMEELALVELTSIKDVAQKMVGSANYLVTEFESVTEDIESILGCTTLQKTEETERKEKLKVDMENAQSSKEKNEKLIEAVQDEIEMARHAAIIKSGMSYTALASLAVMVLPATPVISSLVVGGVLLANHYKEKLSMEDIKNKEDTKHQYTEELYKAISCLSTTPDKKTLAEAAIQALHCAISAIKRVLIILMHSITFWKHLQLHCESPTQSKNKEILAKVMKLPKERRDVFWRSEKFARDAVELYSTWAALDVICTEYDASIKDVNEQMYQFLQENPTAAESRQILKQEADYIEALGRPRSLDAAVDDQ